MVTRISGLASGMDTDTIVKKLMDAERIPLDKLYQKKTYTEWQRDDYREINTALSELDTLLFDEIISKKGTFTQQTVTVSDPDVISVKNSSSSGSLSGSIKVDRVATTASITNTLADKIDPSKLLSDESFFAVPQTLSIIAVNKDGSIDQVKNEFDGTLEDKKVEISIDPTKDTLNDVIKRINDSNAGVTAFYDYTSGQFSITANNAGNATITDENGITSEKPEISLGSDSVDNNFFTSVLGLAANSDAATKGINAKVTYNGVTFERPSNTFTLNGAEITVKKAQGVDDPAVTFSSTSNPDAAIESIKKFVDSYNALIANVQTKLEEKKSASFPPLTDAQKEAMSEEQIKLWEAKARKGTLRSDSTLKSLLSKMRASLYNSVNEASVSSLSTIGITTTNVYQNGGKLQINETKLRAALEEDANGVYELFAAEVKTTDATTGETTITEKGLARRLRDDLSAAMKNISEKAGKASSGNNTFALGRLLENYDDKISSFEERLTAVETRYYNQFAAMEKAISQANSQSTSLTSYFSN